MKKNVLLIFLLSCFSCFSQEDAWVYFKVKNGYDTYINNPLLMLSQRSLDRRNNQKIPLDDKDLPIDKSFIDQVKNVAGIKVLAKSKWLNALHVQGEQTVIRSLTAFPFVDRLEFANVQLNISGRSKLSSKFKEVNKVLSPKVDFPYGNSANQITMLHGDELHKANFTGAGKIIAVIDAGFLGVDKIDAFARLRQMNKILGGYDFVHRSPNFYTGDSHGTEVLSCMAGYKENALIGTAVDASYYLFISENASSEKPEEESYWVEAAEKADSLGVDIINTSLGYFEFDNPLYSHTYAQMNGKTAFISRGAEIAASRGMVVLVSAGNEGNTADFHIGAPADAASVLTVGAVSPTRVIVNFSSRGPSSDGRIKPDVMAQGLGVTVADPNGAIINGSGTSFSCPIMSGVLACLWQAYPNKTAAEIRELVIKSADRSSNPDNLYGYGIPDFALALGLVQSNQFAGAQDFFIYPNPTPDLCTFNLTKDMDKARVRIYTMLGQKIKEAHINKESSTLSLKDLQAGSYLFELESQGLKRSGKLYKQ